METEQIKVPDDVRLEVVSGDDSGRSFTIDNKTVTVGRAEVCDVKLQDPHVSNKHCQIVFRGDHFTAIDLGSLNSTTVNDTAYIQKNLRNGDVIGLGKTRLRFVWTNQDLATVDASEDVPREQ